MDLDKAIGHESEPVPVSWNERDVILYSLGIGSTLSLPLLYELDPSFHPFPTYPLVLPLKGTSTSVNSFAAAKDSGGPTPGLPALDPNRLVHADQSIEVLQELPVSSGEGWTVRKKLVGIKDTGKGLIIHASNELVSPSGAVHTRMIGSSYSFGDFSAGGFSKSILPPPPAQPAKTPTRAPDFTWADKTTPEQAALYRLSGDYNPLHIDPEIGKRIGMGGVILHGLCSYGHAARAVVGAVAGGEDRRLRYMSARFTLPVRPGDELETLMWVSPLADGCGQTRVDFIQQIKATGKVCLGGGVALLEPAGSSSAAQGVPEKKDAVALAKQDGRSKL